MISVIKIIDDGAGLDPEVIRSKVVEKGLIEQNAEPTEKEIFALILTPGFSTAQKTTSASGRRVGIDVVKHNIEVLSGATILGDGTVALILDIPKLVQNGGKGRANG